MTAHAPVDFASSRAKALPWHRIVANGAIGGMTLVAMEMLLLPAGLSATELKEISVLIFPQWMATGIAITLMVAVLERRMGGAALATLFALFALATSVAITILRVLASDIDPSGGTSTFGWNAPQLPTFLYNLWVILFFGGLFMTACVLNVRAERTRNFLARAAIGRARAESMLDEAQMHALRGHVDPQFLLRVMTEVQRRYARKPADADRLLDLLVQFLRHAMPGVRSGNSTLDAELALADAYGKVWSDLDPHRASWEIQVGKPLPRLSFPPLLLLPALDHWVAAAPPHSRCELAVAVDDQSATLSLIGPFAMLGNWVPPEFEFRLRVGLRTSSGSSWRLKIRDVMTSQTPALSIALPVRAQAAPVQPEEANLE